MRLTTPLLLALPTLSLAQTQTHASSPLEQFRATASQYLSPYLSQISWITDKIPRPNTPYTFEAPAAAAAGKLVHTLKLDDWKEKLLSEVKEGEGEKAEWWVMLTGRNKTCYGKCGQIETAFNETALVFATNPTAPHLGVVNCDYEPILCNSWAAGPPSLWIIEASRTGPSPIHLVGLNITNTTVGTFQDLHATQSWRQKPAHNGYFHPLDGPVAQYGLQVPIGYLLWVLALVPSWAMMIGVSFISRTMMGRRMQPQNRAQGAAPGGAAPAVAAPGAKR